MIRSITSKLITLVLLVSLPSVSVTAQPEITTQPSDTVVRETETATFQAIIGSASPITVDWYKAAEPEDILLDTQDPNIQQELVLFGRTPTYLATLSLHQTTPFHSGLYYCRAFIDPNQTVDSNLVRLDVQGLVAHWSLDEDDFINGVHLDLAGTFPIQIGQTPKFIDGADNENGHAVQAQSSADWINTQALNFLAEFKEQTVCLWLSWQETADLQVLGNAFSPNAPSDVIHDVNTLLADGQWHQLCTTYDSNTVQLYADAVPRATYDSPVWPYPWALLDTDADNVPLDDIRLYNMVATPTEIAAVYEAMVGAQEDVDNGARGVHDPVAIKHGDYFYLFHTARGIRIRRSPDLYDWETVGRIFAGNLPEWVEQDVPGVSNLWAPDVSFRNGRYYVYYSASTFGSNRSCIGLASNVTLDPDDPNYAWVDEGKVIGSTPGNNYNTIDGNVLQDHEGQWWLSFGSFWSGIKLIRLDTKTGKPEDGAPLLSIASRPSTAIEAPFIIYRHGLYYLFVSFDSCCRGVDSTYNIRVGRAVSITGPYEDKDGVRMTNGGGTLVLQANERWKGPGHNAVLHENGQDYLLYHAYDGQSNGRSALRIRPIYWSNDGWPEVGTVITGPVE